MTPLDFYGQTYRYQTAGDPEREIGVIRGLGGTWIVGFLGTAGHHRIKSPRLPAGPDPDALQTALDEWASERALPTVSVGPGLQGSAPHPQRTTAGQPQAGRDCRGVPPHPNAAGTATAGDGGADAAAATPAPSVPAVGRSIGESEGPRSPGGARGSAPLNAADATAVRSTVQALLAVGHDPSLIPGEWAAQAALIDAAVAMGQRLTLVLAMVVARARDGFADPSDWLRECTDRWGWQKAHVHHLRAIGDLLIRECRNATLMALDAEKLLAISRLPPDLVGPFLEKAHPQDRSRDDVRAAVNRWLAARGEPAEDASGGAGAGPRKPATRLAQPDFLDALFAAADEPGTEFAERAAARAVDCTDALPVINRAVVVIDSLIPRLDARRPEAFAALAQALRDEASRVEQQAAGLGPRLLPSPQE